MTRNGANMNRKAVKSRQARKARLVIRKGAINPENWEDYA